MTWIYSLIQIFLKWALHFLSLRGDGDDACKCSLPVYYSCKWVVKIPRCHLVSGRGGKQEAKLRSFTYHSTHFCHMKSKLSILGISETSLGSLDPSESAYRKHLFSCIGVLLPSWCRFYFKGLFKVQGRKWSCQTTTDRHENDLLQHNQPTLLTAHNVPCHTALLRMQLGDSSQRYKPGSADNNGLDFCSSTIQPLLRIIQDTAHLLQQHSSSSEIPNGFSEDLHAILFI